MASMSSLNSSCKDYELPGDRLAGHFETTVDLEEGSIEVRSFSKSNMDLSMEREKGEEDTQEKYEIPGTLVSRNSRATGDQTDLIIPIGPEIITAKEEKALGPNPRLNLYVAARGHIQRVIDVALLMNNMSNMASIIKRQNHYSEAQFVSLLVALAFSMVAQVVAGVCFFVAHEKDMIGEKREKYVDYTAYACVALVMVLNMFTSTFGASWISVDRIEQ